MTPPKKTRQQGSGHRGSALLVIAAFKFLKGLGLLIVAFGALHYVHHDLAKEIEHWVDLFRIDPHNHYLILVLTKVAKLDAHKLHVLSVGTFCYSALFLVEGIGLALRKHWAEYLTIISTAGLIPLELYELYKGPSVAKVILLIVNILVVVYLVHDLRRARSASRS